MLQFGTEFGFPVNWVHVDLFYDIFSVASPGVTNRCQVFFKRKQK